MKTYVMSYRYSRDGKTWSLATADTVNATSDSGAIEQVKSKYPYIKDIKIVKIK